MIFLRNQSNLATMGEVREVARAIEAQLREDFALAWYVEPPSVGVWAPDSRVTRRDGVIRLVDTLTEPDALGYHTEDDGGRVTGMVGLQTCKDAGASWTQCASHECLETGKNPFVNMWGDDRAGWSWAFEMCDACQDGSYQKGGVEVSNFVLPAWFDIGNDQGPWDYLEALHAPFTITRLGYAIRRQGGPGTEQQLGMIPLHKQGGVRSNLMVPRQGA